MKNFLEELEKPKTARGKARYEEILSAAHKLFLEKGFERTSINEIVKEAGGSMATAYRWFQNKETLFIVVFLRSTELVSGKIREEIGDPKTVREAFRELLERLFDASVFLADVEKKRPFFSEMLQLKTFHDVAIHQLNKCLVEPFQEALQKIEARFPICFRLGVEETARTIIRFTRCLLMEFVMSPQTWGEWCPYAIQESLNLMMVLIEERKEK
ncbi:MAG: TetR/AcrR family transcriptional regulator [Thermoguttaceae bacterium]|nr:TetR/AcrR family transcriptional regulator [Thermoguttaceae bacterium]MBR0193282.1 TetR/AcrR family transcriptional regulator [Thermoguttaceae bacterium]